MSPSSDSGETNQWVKGDLPPAEDSKDPKPKKTRASAPAKAAVEATPTERASENSLKARVRAGAGNREDAVAERFQTVSESNGGLSLEALVESLLFVADGAVPVAQLASALEVTPREVEAALIVLTETYGQRGLRLQRSRDKVQLTTAPTAAEKVQRFLGLAASAPLTRAALETLAIVAYQQPVTRPQIEAVRGVNSDSVLKNLLSKGLIEETGRSEGPGRPVLYATTPEFLQHFGLLGLTDLPPLNLDQAPVLSEPATEEVLKG